MDISKQDWGFVPTDPEPGFSPDHNKKVIEETIRKAKLMKERAKREFREGLGERAQAVSSYIQAVKDGKTNATFQEYVGGALISEWREGGAQSVKIGDAKKQEAIEKASIR